MAKLCRALVLCVLVAALLAVTVPHASADNEYLLSTASASTQATKAGTAFASNMAVRVVLNTNFTAGVDGVQVTFTAPTSGASGTFAATGTNTQTVTSVNGGFATASTFTANATLGNYSVTVTTDLAPPTAFGMQNTDPHANGVVASLSDAGGSGQAAQTGTAFRLPLEVAVFDGANGHVNGIPVTFTAPSSGPSITFPGGSAVYTTSDGTCGGADGGIDSGLYCTPAITANNIANAPGGSYFVTGTVSGAYTVTGQPLSISFALSNSGTNVNGVPYLISAAAGSGQQAPVDTPFATSLQVVVLDGSQNYVQGATVVFSAPSSGPSGTFAGGGTTFTTGTGPTGLSGAAAITSNAIAGSFAVQVTATKGGVTATGAIGLINGRVKTTTTVTVNPSGSSVYGQPFVLSAAVTPQAGTLVPSAPVTFKQGGVAIGSCTNVSPSSGVATCTQNFLAPASYSFSADYVGDSISQPSSSTAVSYTVHKADTSIDLQTSAPTFVVEGSSVTFTANLSVVAPGGGTPSGGISFTSSDGTLLNGGNPVALTNGSAQVSTSALPHGTPLITATYVGDTNFNGSNKSLTQNVYTVPQVVTNPSSTLVLAGATASFTATATGFPTPTLQWQVSSDGTSYSDVSGATTSPLTFAAAIADDQKHYVAVFTNPAGTATTQPAVLTVRQPPAITSANLTGFTAGTAGSFTVTTTGYLAPTLSKTGALPSGVTFTPGNGGTATIAGTPASGTGGAYPITITASNGTAPDATQAFTLTVNEAPAITSATSATFAVGANSSFTVTAGGYPTPTFSTTSTLPAGVSLTSAGLLSGTPAANSGGLYPLTITANNGISTPATQSFTLAVNQAPALTSVGSTSFTVGTAGSFTVAASGYPAPTLARSTGTLPGGVSFDVSSGVLSGTPAPGTGGTYVLTFTASNGITPAATQSFTLTVNQAPTITSATSATFTAGGNNNFSVTASGFPAPTFSQTGTLPGGVTLNAGTGALSGTPAAGAGGTYPITITASNGTAPDATQAFTLTINATPAITNAARTTFTVGALGTFTVGATGVPAPVLAESGTLPGGVTFTAGTGVLSGTPAAGSGGAYPITFTASNGVSPDATQSFTLTVNEAPAITSVTSATFTANSAGSFTVTAGGYPTPTFSTSSTLPAGVTLSAAGLLAGTPTESGSFPLTLTATNGIVPDATQSFTLTINKADQAALTVTVTPPSGEVGDKLALGTTGGSGSGAISFDAGASTTCALGTGADAGKLLLTGATGSCAVTATKASDALYNSATSTPLNVTVTRAATSLAVAAASGTYGGTTALSATLTRTAGGSPLSGQTVSFTLNGTAAGTATTTASGVATIAAASLAGINAGSYATGVGASFAGDSTYSLSSGTASLTVAKAAGSVSISNLPASGNAGNSFAPTYTALGDGIASTASQTPTTCTVNAGLVSFVAAGTCTLQASVAEGTNYLAATGTPQSVTVGAAARKVTTTTLTSSVNPSSIGQAVTFTASVSANAATGNVTFMDGSSALGTGTLGKGQATLTLSTLGAGTHQVTAVYEGSASYAGSSSTALAQVVNATTGFTLTVTRAGSGSGTVTSSPAGINCGTTCGASFASGTAVTLTAQAASGSTFSGWSGDCTGTSSSCAVSMTAAKSVTATFAANQPAKTATTTTLTSSATPSSVGQAVTFTASVSPSAATGTVTFMDGTATLGTATLNGGTASFTTATLAAGNHSITAVYGGDTNDTGSTSKPLTQIVKKTATTTTLASSLNPSTAGQAVTFTATVSPGAATGTVTFVDGSTALGTGTLSGGTAQFTTSSLTAGTHHITAVYSGDAAFSGGASAGVAQSVKK